MALKNGVAAGRMVIVQVFKLLKLCASVFVADPHTVNRKRAIVDLRMSPFNAVSGIDLSCRALGCFPGRNCNDQVFPSVDDEVKASGAQLAYGKCRTNRRHLADVLVHSNSTSTMKYCNSGLDDTATSLTCGIEDLPTGICNTQNQDCSDKVIPSVRNEVLKCFGTQPAAGIEHLQTSMCKTQNQDEVIPSFSNEVRKSFSAQPAAGTKGLADILARKSSNRLISFNRGGYLSQEPYLYTTKRFFSAGSDALKGAFPCTICFETYNSPSQLTGHYLKSHNDMFDCKKVDSYEKCKSGALFLHRSD